MKIQAKELRPGDQVWQYGLSRLGVGEGWYGPTIVKVEVGEAVVVIHTWNGGVLPYSADQMLEVDRFGLDNT